MFVTPIGDCTLPYALLVFIRTQFAENEKHKIKLL